MARGWHADGRHIPADTRGQVLDAAWPAVLWWSPPPESNRRPHPYHGCALPTELGGPVWDALLGLLGTQLVAMARRHGTWPGSGLSRRPPATCSGGVGGAGNRSTCHEGVRLRAVWTAGDASDGRGRRAVPGCR